MGYAFVIGSCYNCGKVFSFNPRRVPSYKNEPFCRACVEAANPRRIANGLEPVTIHPDAYKPCKEEEL